MDENKYEELVSLVLQNSFLKPYGVFILEHQSRMKWEHPMLQETRKYGNVSFSFFKNESTATVEEAL